MNYFEAYTDVASLRKEYRKLALKHHPDKGGDEEIMKEINAQFDKCKQLFTGFEYKTYANVHREEEAPDGDGRPYGVWWRTLDGKTLLVMEMTNSHIHNAINHIKRRHGKTVETFVILGHLAQELRYRTKYGIIIW